MKQITEFAQRVEASRFSLNEDLVMESGGRYFLLDRRLFPYVQKGFFYAGIYLGKVKDGKFFPSFNLLTMLAASGARSVLLRRKAAWLFIYGRDVFAKGIATMRGSARKGDAVLVLNELGECLGFGTAVTNLESQIKPRMVAVKNVSDVGDFLRRER